MDGLNGPGLICAATLDELWAFGLDGAEEIELERLYRVREGYAAVTGTGIPFTLLALPPLLQRMRPAWVLNLGIAGAYPQSGLEIGDVVAGEHEHFADLGMETPDGGFLPMSTFPFADDLLRAPLPLWIPDWARARRGRGATVNACTGSDATGLRRGAGRARRGRAHARDPRDQQPRGRARHAPREHPSRAAGAARVLGRPPQTSRLRRNP